MSDSKFFSRAEKARYLKNIDGNDYVIPLELVDRFLYLEEKRKVQDGEYIESKRGHTIIFNAEFDRYRVTLKKGQIYSGAIKIKKINGDFIHYKRARKIMGFYFSYGQIYILNKWSFFRIFVSGGVWE